MATEVCPVLITLYAYMTISVKPTIWALAGGTERYGIRGLPNLLDPWVMTNNSIPSNKPRKIGGPFVDSM